MVGEFLQSLRIRRIGIAGRGVWSIPTLRALLDDVELVRLHRFAPVPVALDGLLAWGQRPSALRVAALARDRGLPLLRVEDGFLRSVRLGPDSPPLSVVMDDLGIYFDARAPSRLETLVAAGVDAPGAERAERLRAAWCRARLSKYNHARDDALPAGLPDRCVLVVDQTHGDASIVGGLADAASFSRMLAAALCEWPDSTILLKVHPDVVAGRKRGHFNVHELACHPRVRVISGPVSPVALIEKSEAVYVVTSQLGFEALLHDKPVRVFGMPFYAGWGLTVDELPAPDRRRPVSLADLVHAALVEYSRYIDPETGVRCEAERLVDWMALQCRMRERFPARVYAQGFAPGKIATLRTFLAASEVRHCIWPIRPPAGAVTAIWGRQGAESTAGRRVLTVEDGFLRSVGLGAELVRPLSWVVDDVGIYYDSTRPSRLELMLETEEFGEELCARAARIRVAICEAGVTKYNLGGRPWARPPNSPRVILVPGQVESDASITWGAPGIRRNIDLLRRVREENPAAWLVYKPHPDVVAGVRRVGDEEYRVGSYCNEVVTDVPMHVLLDSVDEVHVLTSLAGFEALLRGLKVTCWGQPFYAGWGLTRDMAPIARRTRVRAIDELVVAALILYPVYVSRASGMYTQPERALKELVEWRRLDAGRRTFRRKLARWFMQLRANVLDR